MAKKLQKIAKKYSPQLVLIEMPSTYSRGKGDAASRSGSIMKLAFCVATLRTTLSHIKVELIPVRRWKGTLKKEITLRRISRRYHVTPVDLNESDAVGIADWFSRKGQYLTEEKRGVAPPHRKRRKYRHTTRKNRNKFSRSPYAIPKVRASSHSKR